MRPRFNPWVGKIPWRRKWQCTPVFLPGESNGQRSLVGYNPWDFRVRQDWPTNTDRQLDNQVLCSISNFIKRINSITSLYRSEMLYLVSVKCIWWKKATSVSVGLWWHLLDTLNKTTIPHRRVTSSEKALEMFFVIECVKVQNTIWTICN